VAPEGIVSTGQSACMTFSTCMSLAVAEEPKAQCDHPGHLWGVGHWGTC